MPELDTPQGETVDSTALGTEAKPSGSEAAPTDKPKETTVDVPQANAELAAIKAERDKVIMERNQLRNKLEEDKTASLLEKEEFKTLYEQAQNRLDEIKNEQEAAEAQKELTTFRNEFISKQPEQLQKVLKNLIDANPSNFLWTDAKDWDDAGAQLQKQAKAIADAMGLSEDAAVEPGADAPKINANNPAVTLNGMNVEDMSFEELGKILPRAAAR